MSKKEYPDNKFNDFESLCNDFENCACFEAVKQISSDTSSTKDLHRSKESLEYLSLCTSASHPHISSEQDICIGEDKENNTKFPLGGLDILDKYPNVRSELSSNSTNHSLNCTECMPETIVSFEPTQITYFSGFDAAPEHVQKVPTQFRPIYSNRLANSSKQNEDNFEPTDILKEAIQILRSLSSDISKSLDEIPKSIALPSVIEKYSRRAKCNTDSPRQNSSFDDISAFMSPGQEIVQLLAALQCRCLEYREVTQEIAEEIVKECISDDAHNQDLVQNRSMYRIKTLISKYDLVREDFTSFRQLCVRSRASRIGEESLGDLVTDCLQTSYLRLMVEENETFLVRLKFGIYMVRVNARLVKDLREAAFRMQELEKEMDMITKCTIGYKV